MVSVRFSHVRACQVTSVPLTANSRNRIGDWYPERNIFQVLIALTAGPRFALVTLLYYLQRSQDSSLPTVVFISGLVRTISCGGWVYITSSDDHDVHDVLMITYIVCDLPWMLGGVACTQNTVVRRKRCVLKFKYLNFH